ncbi:MAG: TerB family tellurite resistance protein [Chloroflexi bacterium]|nr:TerB family tellurite resistance protein [Chloroflexota bacterium]
MFQRLFGGGSSSEAESPAPASESATADTVTIRRIASQLGQLPMEQRRSIAGFAYVLSRAAHADLHISPEEVAFMERTVQEVTGLPEAQAVLVVEIARTQAELMGATEDYLVTREFAAQAPEDERLQLLRLAFRVGAADDTITAEEVAELNQIGKELGFTAAEVDAVRLEFRDQLSAIQAMRAAREA